MDQRFPALWAACAAFCALLAASTAAGAVSLENLEDFEPLYGLYAPAGDCTRQPHTVVDRIGFTFNLPSGIETANRPEYAASYGGDFHQGISLWFFPYFDPGGPRPLLLTFNAGEVPGVLTVDTTDYDYSGGPRLPGKYRQLVDGSPYAVRR